jgi:hypothetical protein
MGTTAIIIASHPLNAFAHKLNRYLIAALPFPCIREIVHASKRVRMVRLKLRFARLHHLYKQLLVKNKDNGPNHR